MLKNILDWMQSPIYSERDVIEFGAGVVILFCAAFLWSRVLREMA